MLNDAKARELITCSDPKGFGKLHFVKAGAGAGKTTSIKQRVVNFIKHKDLSPEKLVAITYTTKATNNLISGLREEIEAELKSKDLEDIHRPKLEKALATLAYGKISTFHSFCFDLLREYPIEFNVDPDAEIGDERSQDSLFEAVYEQMTVDLLLVDSSKWPESLKCFKELTETLKSEDYLKSSLRVFYFA